MVRTRAVITRAVRRALDERGFLRPRLDPALSTVVPQPACLILHLNAL